MFLESSTDSNLRAVVRPAPVHGGRRLQPLEVAMQQTHAPARTAQRGAGPGGLGRGRHAEARPEA